MKKRIGKFISVVLCLALLCSAIGGCEQKDTGTAGKKTIVNLKDMDIRQDEMLKQIEELISYKYTGRLTGTEGNRLATEYLAERFKEIGLQTPEGIVNYMQHYTQAAIVLKEKPVLQIVDGAGGVVTDFDYPESFVLRRLSSKTEEIDITASMVLLKSVTMLDENNSDMTGKVILIPSELSYLTGNHIDPYDTTLKCGTSAVICEFDLSDNELGYRNLKVIPLQKSWQQEAYNPFIFVDSGTFAKLTGAAEANKKLHFCCSSDMNLQADAANVIGVIPGSDPILKDQYIIIGAHFDHVGDNMDGTINHGALDNASGPAAMLEIARIIKESGMAPKKTIVFVGFNGESSGFIGSDYYVKNSPYPLNQTNSVMINLDMVGSAKEIPLLIAAPENSPSAMKALRDKFAVLAGDLDIAYEAGTGGGSDHQSFANRYIPSVFLSHPDFGNGYHSPNDTIEDISGERLKEIVRLVLYYIEKNAFLV